MYVCKEFVRLWEELERPAAGRVVERACRPSRRDGLECSTQLPLSFPLRRFLANLLLAEVVENRPIQRTRMVVGLRGDRQDDQQVSRGQWFNALIEPRRSNRPHR